jgi:hypothetical protein
MASKSSLEERNDAARGNAMVAVAKALSSEERARTNAKSNGNGRSSRGTEA